MRLSFPIFTEIAKLSPTLFLKFSVKTISKKHVQIRSLKNTKIPLKVFIFSKGF